MKAIILERRGDEAAVLCEDGTIVKVRQEGEVGETIELEAAIIPFPKKKNGWLAKVAAVILMLTISGSTFGYTTASAYVSLDIADSALELKVNHFGRVIAVNALNDDTEELAASLSGEVRNRKAEDALDYTMTYLQDGGYFADTDTALIAGVMSGSEKRKEELKRFVEHSTRKDGELAAFIFEGTPDERKQAREQQIGVGRFVFERDFEPSAGEPKTPQPGQGDKPAQDSRDKMDQPVEKEIVPGTDMEQKEPSRTEGTPKAEPTRQQTPAPPVQRENQADEQVTAPAAQQEPTFPAEPSPEPQVAGVRLEEEEPDDRDPVEDREEREQEDREEREEIEEKEEFAQERLFSPNNSRPDQPELFSEEEREDGLRQPEFLPDDRDSDRHGMEDVSGPDDHDSHEGPDGARDAHDDEEFTGPDDGDGAGDTDDLDDVPGDPDEGGGPDDGNDNGGDDDGGDGDN